MVREKAPLIACEAMTAAAVASMTSGRAHERHAIKGFAADLVQQAEPLPAEVVQR